MERTLVEDFMLANLKSQLKIKEIEFHILLAYDAEETDSKSYTIVKNTMLEIKNQIEELENR